MVRILEIENNSLKLLQVEKLQKIFKAKIENPICIITLCGSKIPNDTVKTECPTNNKPIPKTDTSEIIQEIINKFDNTRPNHTQEESAGIWILETPYTSTKTNCRVYIMYVHGPFEETISDPLSRAYSAMFTLSILLSSVFVVNIQNFHIPEEMVKLFKIPLEFAKLVKTQDSTVTPFQSLNILVHNWNPDSDFEVGKSGGAKYLKDQLEQNIQTAQADNLHQNLKSAFSKVECILFPDKTTNTKKKPKYPYEKCMDKFLHVLEQQKDKKLFLGNQMVANSFAGLCSKLVEKYNICLAAKNMEFQTIAHELLVTAKEANTGVLVESIFYEIEALKTEPKKMEEKGKQMIQSAKKFGSTNEDIFQILKNTINEKKTEEPKTDSKTGDSSPATTPVEDAPVTDVFTRQTVSKKLGAKSGSFMRKFKLPSKEKKTGPPSIKDESRDILMTVIKDCESQIYQRIGDNPSQDAILVAIESVTKAAKDKLGDELETYDEDVYRSTVKKFDEMMRGMRNSFLTGSPMPTFVPSPPQSENKFDMDQQSISSGVSSEYRIGTQTPKRAPSNASKKPDDEDGIAIGIDLGTTYCCMGVVMNGGVKIIPNAVGKNTTPSYLVKLPTGKYLIGEAAKKRAAKVSETKLYNVKRILGCSYSDKKLQEDIKTLPYTVIDEDDCPKIKIGDTTYLPEEISAELLMSLIKDAEKFLRQKVTKAVITVPAYFNDNQRRATVDAGEMAGLNVLGIMTEPTAAAIAYKMDNTDEIAKYFLVFDLGGGTFDVALFQSVGGNIETLAIDGDTHLGGEDFDLRMVDHCVEQIKEETDIDFYDKRNSSNKKEQDEAYRKLKRIQMICEKQKEDFCTSPETEIVVDAIAEDYDLEVTMTKETFEEINKSHFEKTIEVVQRVLQSKGLNKNQIGDVILIGGSSKITRIQELLKSYFSMDSLNNTINPDEAVAYGAAVHAAALNAKVTEAPKTFDKFMQKIVAMNVQDVTPISYGIDMNDGRLSVIIPRHTKIPSTCSQRYATANDFESSVTIQIFQGEHPLAKQNTSLGKFVIDGIPQKKAGEETVKVDMSINNNGILEVSATIESTNHTKSITVDSAKNSLIKEKIEAAQQQINRQLSTTDSGWGSDREQ